MLDLSEDHVWTYEDYCRLPEDGNRYEVIDGRLYVSPGSRSVHQLVSRRIQFLFYAGYELTGKGFVFNAPMDLRMEGCDPVQPDLVYFERSQRDQVKEKFLEGAPTLIIEILSPGNARHDRVTKMSRYARSKVPHYWVADPEERTLELFELDRGSYRLVASLGPGDRHRPLAFCDIELGMDELFAPL